MTSWADALKAQVRRLRSDLDKESRAGNEATLRALHMTNLVFDVLALHREEIDFDGCCHYCAECTRVACSVDDRPTNFRHDRVVTYPCATVEALRSADA